jgi:hypothetical protein
MYIVLGQEQTFHKFDVHRFSILPLILVFSAFYVRTIKELILILLIHIQAAHVFALHASS